MGARVSQLWATRVHAVSEVLAAVSCIGGREGGSGVSDLLEVTSWRDWHPAGAIPGLEHTVVRVLQ